MKAAMEILGMTAGPVRPPLVDCTSKDIADLKVVLEAYADVLAVTAR
jgi:5-dehydro-4-deoxyglucarate dehydratase